MSGGYHEYRFYSPLHDKHMVRLSMFNARGHEYFMLIPEHEGRRYRERRIEALDNIEYAISQGMEPGQVIVIEHA